jgi:hypothetical protein
VGTLGLPRLELIREFDFVAQSIWRFVYMPAIKTRRADRMSFALLG